MEGSPEMKFKKNTFFFFFCSPENKHIIKQKNDLQVKKKNKGWEIEKSVKPNNNRQTRTKKTNLKCITTEQHYKIVEA